MKLLVLLLLISINIFLLKNARAQNMDLSTIIKDEEKAMKFINHNFISNENAPALSSSHSLFMYRINRIVKNKSTSFVFYGIPSVAIDAYVKSKTEYIIYFRAKIKDMLGFKKITDELGYPVNVTVEEYNTGDFDFLNWRQVGFEIFASHLREEDANILFKIGTLTIKDLYKIENVKTHNDH